MNAISENAVDTKPSSDDRLLSKREVANRFSVSIKTVERMVYAGRLAPVFLNRSVRFKNSDIERIVAKGT